MDVVHPDVRSTDAAVLALFQNLLGMAVGPVLVSVLSDQFGLHHAMTMLSVESRFAATCFIVAARTYNLDLGACRT